MLTAMHPNLQASQQDCCWSDYSLACQVLECMAVTASITAGATKIAERVEVSPSTLATTCAAKVCVHITPNKNVHS